MLYFESAAGQPPLAAYVNFSLHLDTTGGYQFSADYPYTLGKILKLAKGDGFSTMFTIGASGNVNHFDVSKKDPQGSFEEAARIGAVLAGEVLKVVQEAPIVFSTAIRVGRSVREGRRSDLQPRLKSPRQRPSRRPSVHHRLRLFSSWSKPRAFWN